MEENKRNTIIRFAAVFLLMACGFAAVLGKIIYTQTAKREALLQTAQRLISRDAVVSPNRGNIYDANNNLLAGSAAIYHIYMDTRVQALHKGNLFNEKIDSVADALSSYFKDRSAQEYKDMIISAHKKGVGRLLLYKKRITHSQLQDVKRMPLFRLGSNKSGLIAEEEHQRIKPFDLLASRTIGNIYISTGKGNSGLELQYEEWLCGKAGHKQTQMIDGRVIVSADKEAEDGDDIVTTLDVNLQDIVETQLLQTLNRLQADWGCCILMEVKTGEVKAIANLGLTNSGYTEDQNYAVTRVEPGSTFKTISLMAALDDSNIRLTDTINTENGKWIYCDPKHPITDTHKYPKLTVQQVLAASSNIGLAKIITQTYERKASRFVSKLDKMGICDSIPFEIPGMQISRIDIPSDKETLARMAFGYSVEMSPIAILTFYNAIANDGKMICPFLVKKIQHNGRTLKEFSTSVLQTSICKSSTLKDIRQCLESVVWDNQYGTASINPWGNYKAQSEIVHIAGKTGTARILDNGAYLRNQHRITFCGYFPMEEPQYTCICMIQRPRSAYDAGFDCGGTVRRIAEKTMAYASNIPVKQLYKDSIALPPVKRGWQTDIRKASKGTGITVKTCEAKWVHVNEQYTTEAMNVCNNLVPNIIGMGAKDAIYAIEQTGMHARITGKGKVVAQSVAPGSKTIKGGTIYIELR